MHPALAARLTALHPAGAPAVLADRPDGTVLGNDDAVIKAHAPDTDHAALATRLRIAAAPQLAGILLPPLGGPAPHPPVDGRPVTLWARGTPVDPDDPDAAPWPSAGRLLARLHTLDTSRLPGPVPPMRGPLKAARAVARLHAAPHIPEAAPILAAWQRLPAWARADAPAPPSTVLCHGDLHLGQLVRHPAPDGPWLLIDVDDLGLGDPAWDLARPAAGYATGIIAPAAWESFLTAYRAAGGPAAGADDTLWPPRLDVPARALTVQLAALYTAKAATDGRPLDDLERELVDACARIAALPPAPRTDMADGPPRTTV